MLVLTFYIYIFSSKNEDILGFWLLNLKISSDNMVYKGAAENGI